MIDRVQVKAIAKNALNNNYWLAVGMFVLFSIITGACGSIPYVGVILGFLVVPVFTVAFMNCCLKMVRGEKVEIGDLFKGFNNYGHNLGGYWWMSLWVGLWSLLCYIPGIIKSYSYAQTIYILMDEPDIEATEALEKSKQMMEGHKMELFILHLSFIGWSILAAFTCGIVGIFYVYPYMMLAMAAYYELLKRQSGLFYTVVNPVNSPNGGSYNGAYNNSNPVNPVNTIGTSASQETPAISSSDSIYEASSVSEFIKEDNDANVNDTTDATSSDVTTSTTADDTADVTTNEVTSEEVEKFVNPIDAIIDEYDKVEKENSNTDSYDAFGDNK